MRTVKVFEEAWPLHTPFVIARGSRSEARVVVVELEEEGIKGTGECTPYPRCKYMSIYLKTLKLLRVTLHKSVNKLAQIV